MSFIEKVELALESICGVADSISIERKKELVPETDWEAKEEKTQKLAKRKTKGKKPGQPQQPQQQLSVSPMSVKFRNMSPKKQVEASRVRLEKGKITFAGSGPQLR
jgi:hypothetical protein